MIYMTYKLYRYTPFYLNYDVSYFTCATDNVVRTCIHNATCCMLYATFYILHTTFIDTTNKQICVYNMYIYMSIHIHTTYTIYYTLQATYKTQYAAYYTATQ